MTIPDQVYKTTIKTTPEKLWEALTNPEFTKQYWFGNANISTWKSGANWKHVGVDSGTVHHIGKIEEIDPPHKLVLSWHNEGNTVDISRVTFDITQAGDDVTLIITHGDFVENSSMANRVSGGWPKVIEGLKNYLERTSLGTFAS